MKTLIAGLFERRILQYVVIYIGVAWGAHAVHAVHRRRVPVLAALDEGRDLRGSHALALLSARRLSACAARSGCLGLPGKDWHSCELARCLRRALLHVPRRRSR